MKGRRTLAALLLLGSASVAQAGPGNGIRFGGSSGRLHPYLELEGRYDSNVAFTEQGEKTSGFVFHVRPGLTLESNTEPAAVKLDAQLDWAQYTGKNSGLSRLFGKAELGVGFNRRGQVGVELLDSFRRSSSTQVMTLPSALVQTSNQLKVSVPWRPGGGAFVTTVYGGWDLESFSKFDNGLICQGEGAPCEQSQISDLGYSDVTGGLELRWRFLPRTAALVQGEYWKRLPADEDVGGKPTGWRAWGGLAGLFGAHLAGTAKAGYGSISNVPGSFSSWLANAEVEWIPLETTSLKLGYIHDLGADPGRGGGYTSHRGYAQARALLAGMFTPQLRGSYEHRNYPEANDFTADLFTVEPSVDVELARWLILGAGVAYTKRTSDVPGAGATTDPPAFGFDKTEAFLRVRGIY